MNIRATLIKEIRGHPLAAPVKWQTHAPAPQERPFFLQHRIPRRRTCRALGSQRFGCAVAHQSPIRIKALSLAVDRRARHPWRPSPPQKAVCSPAWPLVARYDDLAQVTWLRLRALRTCKIRGQVSNLNPTHFRTLAKSSGQLACFRILKMPPERAMAKGAHFFGEGV